MKKLDLIFWASVIFTGVFVALWFFVAWFMPHGPVTFNGKYDCPNSVQQQIISGDCQGEETENVNAAHIPKSAKFIRNYGSWFIYGGALAGGLLYFKRKVSTS